MSDSASEPEFPSNCLSVSLHPDPPVVFLIRTLQVGVVIEVVLPQSQVDLLRPGLARSDPT